MKRIIVALAALGTLAATPAFAGLVDEVATERNTPAQLVSAPSYMKGAGAIVTSEHDGTARRARTDGIRLVPSSPRVEDLNASGGR